MTDAARGPAQDSVESNGSPPVLFSLVRLGKFILLSIVTWGLYPAVWYYSFVGHIGASGDFVLVVAYFLLVGAWRLDDPYWLVTGLSFFLSPEGGGDRQFIEEVERRRGQWLPRTITT